MDAAFAFDQCALPNLWERSDAAPSPAALRGDKVAHVCAAMARQAVPDDEQRPAHIAHQMRQKGPHEEVVSN